MVQSTPEKITTTPKGSTQDKLNYLEIELEKAQTPEQKKVIRNEMLSIRRSVNRTKQYSEIASLKLAEGKNNLDNISAADLMRLDKGISKERRGEFLSKSFLYKQTTDKDGNIFQEPTDGKSITEGNVLYVDFGNNKSANNRIGLGHMLGIETSHIKVNGKIGVRSIVNNRVGYYVENSAKGYLPVYTGDLITIPTPAEIGGFKKDLTSKDIVQNTKQEDSDTANDAYIGRLESTSIHAVEVNVNINESYVFWKSKGFTHEQTCGIIANEYKESNGNPRAMNGTVAVGIFQWEKPRSTMLETQFGKKLLDMSHSEQLEAAYWEMTQGGEGKVLQPLKGAKTAREAGAIFSELYERPKLRDHEMNTRGEMAEAFAILLDPEGRSNNLGDHIVQKGPTGGKTDSCGAAVRDLLKGYGINGLPESGADGKNWESILNDRPSQFIKMKISHPDQAYPGAILVYGKGADLAPDGSNRDKYGHVEIKGSDGRYYSYYVSSQEAGSTKTNEKNPEKYANLTGFIGYAYYPKQSKSS